MIPHGLRPFTAAALLTMTFSAAASAQSRLVNMIPQNRSAETNQDSEPTLAIDPNSVDRMAGSAFTYDNLDGSPMTTATAPIYVSIDRGATWTLALTVPSLAGAQFPTGDITLSFSSTLSGAPSHLTSWLYAGILSSAASPRPMTVLRTQDYLDTGTLMTTLDTRPGRVDQPHTLARTDAAAGQDRLYVGFNNGFGCVAPQGRSSTLDVTQSAAAGAPSFALDVIESRNTPCQDGFAQVPAPHRDGTVYAAFIHDWSGSPRLVVVRDDAWGTGSPPFGALVDPSDSKPGRFVTPVLTLPFGYMGQNRLGASNVSIAVDPRNSDRVYVAYGDSNGADSETIHVRRSINRGKDWSGDLLTVTSALNPEIAINSAGAAGVLYQRFASNRWEAHLTRTTDQDATVFDNPGILLASTDATTPSSTFDPYIGDYASLVAAGTNFYGVFTASNFPDAANFLPGVVFQRDVDWAAHKLYADAAHTTEVAPSIDPYFFEVDSGPQLQVPGNIQLGDACAGGSSIGTLNVCNTGTSDLIVGGITSSNPAVAVTTPSAGFPVTISHDFCFPFQVVFTAAAAGPALATLTISSNDAKNPTTVTVSAKAGAPDIRVTGSTAFGVTSNWTPAEKTVAVCNTGSCSLAVTAASTSCADFTLVDNPFPAALSPGACLNLVVRFTPRLPGHKVCDLKVASDDTHTPLVTRTLSATTPPLFSVHGGWVDPHGAFHLVAKQGSTLNLDFVDPFTPHWAWDVRLGYSRFDGRAGNPDTGVVTLSADAKFTINPAAPVRVFLDGGFGMYQFNPGDFDGGGNVGLGIDAPLGHRFVLEAAYNFHSAFTASPALNFSQLQLGLLVSF
jgi:hypothetical protein